MFTTSTFNRFAARRHLMGLALGAFGLIAITACAELDAAAAKAIVQNIDSLSGEVTVQFKDGTTTTFNLEDVDVEALGQLIGDASLQPGDEIEVELDSSNSVTAVTTQVASVHATVISVDTDANTITLEAENGIELTLDLTAETKIQLDEHQPGTVDDLAAGLAVKVKYNPDTEAALRIRIDEDDDDHGGGHGDDVRGVITAINNDDHSISVEGADGVETVHILTPGTEIKVRGPAHFGDLEVGMPVKVDIEDDGSVEEVKFDDGNHGHDEDHDDEGKFVGTISAIDAENHEVTVQAGNGTERTFTVDSETEVDVRGDAEFSDLEVDMMVVVEFERASLVAEEIKVKFDNSGPGNAHEGIDAIRDSAELRSDNRGDHDDDHDEDDEADDDESDHDEDEDEEDDEHAGDHA